MGKDNGQGFGFFSVNCIGWDIDFLLEDMAIEEHDGAEGLVLRGGREGAFSGKVGNEGLYFLGAHVFGVAFFVEEDVAANPVYVCLFGAKGVMFDTDGVADLIQQFTWGFFHVDLLRGGVYNLLIIF